MKGHHSEARREGARGISMTYGIIDSAVAKAYCRIRAVGL